MSCLILSENSIGGEFWYPFFVAEPVTLLLRESCFPGGFFWSLFDLLDPPACSSSSTLLSSTVSWRPFVAPTRAVLPGDAFLVLRDVLASVSSSTLSRHSSAGTPLLLFLARVREVISVLSGVSFLETTRSSSSSESCSLAGMCLPCRDFSMRLRLGAHRDL